MNDYSKEKEAITRIQNVIFPILCEIDDFCRKRNIRYFLCAGSCLGAIRHKGFIPWDYDADIMFPREDYNRFIHEYYSSAERKYEIGALEVDNNWKRQFGRVWDTRTVLKHRNLNDIDVGACVDLFPIDGITDNTFLATIDLTRMRLLEFLAFNVEKKRFHEEERYILIKKILKATLKPLGWRFFSDKMNRLAQKYPFSDSKHVGVWIDPGYGKREIMDRTIFDKAIYMEFNGKEFPVPEEYDEYLKNLYGDYMTVPEGALEHCYMQIRDWELEFCEEET